MTLTSPSDSAEIKQTIQLAQLNQQASTCTHTTRVARNTLYTNKNLLK